MVAEILCVGTELLLGDIVNTNAAYLSKQLAALGIDVYHQSVVGDNQGRLRDSLKNAFSRADIVIMTGGLGPTYDDLTKETVAEYFSLPMELHEESKKRMLEYFARRGTTPTPNNLKQALMPAGAVVFENDTGTAPGLAVEKDGKVAVLMPGPPFEMQAMFEGSVRPWLLKFSDKVLVSRTVHIAGIGESAVEHRLKDMMLAHTNPTVAPYAKQGEVQLRVTAAAKTREEAYAMTLPVLEEIREAVGEYIYGIDVGTQENAAVSLLREKRLWIATAESCSGGLLSKRITDIPGASEVFRLGVCAYADAMKVKVLGVGQDTLDRVGAVSEEVAAEMAAGVRRLAGADIGVGITGIAGPSGGTEEKPVGLIYVAVDSERYRAVEKYLPAHRQGGGRDHLRYMATQMALRMVLRALKEY